MEAIVVMQLINPMEVIMVTQFFTWLLSAFARKRVHKCAHTMLRLDDHMLRDIGLTQTDVEHCMASPSQMTDGCMPARRSQNLEAAAAVAECEAKAQALPPTDGLAA
jgi:uncharacterized protein YjiS (DUF1127 family)